jgi:hypothetical protein
MYKEFRDVTLNGAVDQLYTEMASLHRIRASGIQIVKTATVPSNKCKREKVTMMHVSLLPPRRSHLWKGHWQPACREGPVHCETRASLLQSRGPLGDKGVRDGLGGASGLSDDDQTRLSFYRIVAVATLRIPLGDLN